MVAHGIHVAVALPVKFGREFAPDMTVVSETSRRMCGEVCQPAHSSEEEADLSDWLAGQAAGTRVG